MKTSYYHNNRKNSRQPINNCIKGNNTTLFKKFQLMKSINIIYTRSRKMYKLLQALATYKHNFKF
jgi:hypothetical protein